MVDEVAGTVGRRHLELALRRGDGRDGRAQERAELHGGQPDTSGRTQHEELLAGTYPRHGPEDVVGGAVRHTERSC